MLPILDGLDVLRWVVLTNPALTLPREHAGAELFARQGGGAGGSVGEAGRAGMRGAPTFFPAPQRLLLTRVRTP
ncbi:MAG: hypothetical protein RIF41_14450 [Polyangiaceae bacterium]